MVNLCPLQNTGQHIHQGWLLWKGIFLGVFLLSSVLLLDDVGSDGCLEDIGESEGVGGLAAVGAEDADSGTGRHVWRVVLFC